MQKLVSEVNNYSEVRSTLEQTARRLTELSRKEDCDVIHNLMMIVLDRHKKLQLRAAERGKILEEVKKNAKQVHLTINASLTGCVTLQNFCVLPSICIFQFNESWRLMMDWMMEVDRALDTHKEIAMSHEEIKQQLTEQKVR